MKTILTLILLWLCISISRADERIFVENAKVNGIPVRLALDTGADDIYLFSPAPARLGIKVAPIKNIWQQKIGIATEKCTIEFWTFFKRRTISVIGLPPFTCSCDGMDGLVGWQAVSDKTLVFDTASNTVQFAREVPAESAQWTKLKLCDDSVLVLEVPDDGKTRRMAIDTGSESGFGLSPEKWRKWKAAHASQPITLRSAYMPGPREIVVQEQAWASEFTLGPLSFTDMVIEESEPFSARNAGKEHIATLGLAAMKRLDLIIDGKHSWAYVRPKKNPAAPYEHNRLGATFVPRDSQSDPLIARVVTGSPAYEAGIRRGDELLKINDHDVTKWRTMTNRPSGYWEESAGTQFELTLRRSNETFRAAVTLRDILPPKMTAP
jgi:hypothetical protein